MALAPAAAAEYELPPPPEVSTGTIRLEFSADRVEYESSTGTVRLEGRVVVRESTTTLRADALTLDTRRRSAKAEGFLLVDDGVAAMHGEGGEFEFESHTGVLYNAKAQAGDWRVSGRRLKIAPGNALDYRGAWFTGCSVEKPHYHFRSSRLKVVPKKHLFATNAVFYLGRVPILYSPFIYKSLKPAHLLRVKIEPGYDRRNGPFVKSTLATEHGPNHSSRLYLDYYSSQGVGAGAELQRRRGLDSRGVLFGYRIRETHNGRERWAILGNQYEAFYSSFAFQGRLQLQSDGDFNNHYARASAFRVTPELNNSAAVVYHRRNWTTRLGTSRIDVAEANRFDYVRQEERAPRLEIQSAPLRIWRLPWLNSFSANAESNVKRGRAYTERLVSGAWEGTRMVPLARGVSFTPKVGYSQTYLNRFEQAADFSSTDTVKDAFVGRWSTEGNLRFATIIGDWDFGHRFQRRQKANTLTDDAGAIDHGIETNLIFLQDAFRPTRRILARVGSGYDHRVFRDRSLGFRERVQPILGELIYTPRGPWSVVLRDEYALQDGNRSVIASAQYGEDDGRFVGAGAVYNRAQPDSYFGDLRFGWANSTGSWRVGGALRGLAVSRGGPQELSRLRLFEKELQLSRRWHDFFTRAIVRLRPGGVKEFQIRIEMILPTFDRARAARRDWEAEWFPERASGAVERP